MRIEEVKIYQFDELSEDAKQVAIEGQRQFEFEDGHMSDCIHDVFTDKLAELGYPTSDVQWSLSYCQGDGMAFYGRVGKKGMQKLIERLVKDGDQLYLLRTAIEEGWTIDGEIERTNYYYNHYNSMGINIFDSSDDAESIAEDLIDMDEEAEDYSDMLVNMTDDIEAAMQELEEAIAEDIEETSRALERQGYELIEDFTSDESLAETIRANEYEFTEDGKMCLYKGE